MGELKDMKELITVVTIPLEEYKELLMIKGAYEELKKSQLNNTSIITYGYSSEELVPKKVTC